MSFQPGIAWPVALQQARHSKGDDRSGSKTARIVYHMITTRQEYDTTVFQELERHVQDRKRMKLQPSPVHLASNSSRGRLFLWSACLRFTRRGHCSWGGRVCKPQRRRRLPAKLPLPTNFFQLAIASRVDLGLSSGEPILRRHLADGAVHSHRVVVDPCRFESSGTHLPASTESGAGCTPV